MHDMQAGNLSALELVTIKHVLHAGEEPTGSRMQGWFRSGWDSQQ